MHRRPTPSWHLGLGMSQGVPMRILRHWDSVVSTHAIVPHPGIHGMPRWLLNPWSKQYHQHALIKPIQMAPTPRHLYQCWFCNRNVWYQRYHPILVVHRSMFSTSSLHIFDLLPKSLVAQIKSKFKMIRSAGARKWIFKKHFDHGNG